MWEEHWEKNEVNGEKYIFTSWWLYWPHRHLAVDRCEQHTARMFEFAAENWETKCSASSEVYVKVKVCGAAFSIESRKREGFRPSWTDCCGCSLRVLDLAGNQLEGLPPPLQWKTQILKELVVSLNKITKVSEYVFFFFLLSFVLTVHAQVSGAF